MTRPQSAETTLRHVKRQLKDVTEQLIEAQKLVATYRIRATQAEQDRAEWQRRFDALLELKDRTS